MIICIGVVLVRPLGLQCWGHPEKVLRKISNHFSNFQVHLTNLTFPMVDTEWNSQTLFRAPGTKYTNSHTKGHYWEYPWSERPARDRGHCRIFKEALIESRKTLDCQAMEGTRNSSYVILRWCSFLKEVNSSYKHFCCVLSGSLIPCERPICRHSWPKA